MEIFIGRQRPYYIKSLGREQGVYIRVAGTSRPADEYMIKELLLEGSNRSFDQVACVGLKVTDDEVDELCRSLKETALRYAHSEEERSRVKAVTVRQLLSWGVLQEREGEIIPTNAYAILTGNDALPVAIQCGVFKGETKAIFVDRREFDGKVQEQIEEAFQFVLRNIHLGARFQGIYRQDVYEIPPDAIRELIINAVVHRSYLDHGNIQVAVYDNRLEITSPGKLPMGQTIERMIEGYSRIRNEALANAFSYMNLIEHWGSGIPRINQQLREVGLRELEFIGGDTDLRINIYRGQSEVNDLNNNANGVKNGVNGVESGVNSNELTQEEKLLALIEVEPEKTQTFYSEQMGASKRTVSRMFVTLQEQGVIENKGSRRKPKWIVRKK